MPNPTTNFKDSFGTDLGNKIITKEYLMTVYPQIANQLITPELWTWGDNYGQLGINDAGDTLYRSTPVTTFAGGANWKQVACGPYFTSAAIKTDGTLWTWGNNENGELGVNDTTQRNTPVTTFAGGTNWKQVSCGLRNMAAIKTDGTLWTWGSDYTSGALGRDSQYGMSCTPITTFAGGNDWKQVSCGYHTAAIKTDGTLWVWGYDGGGGALGIDPSGWYNTRSFVPVTTFAGGTNWKQVSCSNGNNRMATAAIKTDGTLWVWGDNSYGKLGINDITEASRNTPVTTFAGGTNWKQVSCGSDRHMAAIKTDGTLWVWGRDAFGQLGINTAVGVEIDGGEEGPITVNARFTPVTTFAGGTNWKQVTCGGTHTAAIKTDGTLWVWGRNTRGQLGFPNATTTVTINASVSGTVTATPPFYSTFTTTNTQGLPVGVTASYTVTTSPNNAELNGTYLTYIAVENSTMYLQPLVTSSYTGTLTFSGTVSSGGATQYSNPTTTFAGGTNWKQVSSGTNHTTAIRTSDDLQGI